MDEKTAIQTCLTGNVNAFESLVKHYETRIIALAWNILGDRDDAKDVAQDTFIQAYKNLQRYDLQRSFKTWLMAIAVKRCLDRIRKQKSFFKYFKHHSQNTTFSKEPNSHSIEESEIFHPLLNRLTKKERTALCLKVNERYTSREIGSVLNCSETTARVYLFRAKKKLKKALLSTRETGERTSLERCSYELDL